MDIMEKLVELLGNIYLPMMDGSNTVGEYTIPHKFKEKIADYLITNGVTVQSWIPVTERLPDEHESLFARYKGTDKWLNGMFMTISDLVIVCVECENGERIVKTAITKEGVWKIKDSFHPCRVTHWMPMPQPPKGE